MVRLILIYSSIIGVMVSSSAAIACRSPLSEYTIFFDGAPTPPKEAAPIQTRVRILDVVDTNGRATADAVVLEDVRGLKAGDAIQLEYRLTSCGPYQRAGDEGTIYATKGDTGAFHPFMRPVGGGMIQAPRELHN